LPNAWKAEPSTNEVHGYHTRDYDPVQEGGEMMLDEAKALAFVCGVLAGLCFLTLLWVAWYNSLKNEQVRQYDPPP